jgi:phosphohistidine phosphatase
MGDPIKEEDFMALYLVQHGKSLSKEMDPEQHLSETGIAETQNIARVAAGYQVAVKRIHHSVKIRARQTAEIFAESLHPADGVHQIDGIKPMDDVTTIAPVLNPEDAFMLVGHLPFMARLTAYLVTGRTEPSVFKFQNSGIVCLDRQLGETSWQIIWTLMPHHHVA